MSTSKIMVIGKAEPQLRHFTQVLLAAGYEATDAESNAEAIDLARQMHPNLVLMHSQLDAESYELARRIKAEPGLPQFLVVYLVDSGRVPHARLPGLQNPGDGLIQHPLRTEEFLDRVRSFLRIQKAEEALSRHAKVLFEITIAQQEIASANPDPDVIMKLVADRAQSLTNADGAVIELLEGEDMVCRAASGIMKKQLGARVHVGSSFSGLCVRTDEVMRCDDALNDARLAPEENRDWSIRSIIGVPLRYQYNSMGVLEVMSRKPGAFSDADIQTLQLMAFFMATAINQAVTLGAKQALLAEHTRTILALRESEERFRSAFDFAAIGMALVGMDGRWMKINHTLCEILGYAEAEFRSLTFYSLTHPDDLEDQEAAVKELVKGAGSFQIETRCFHKSGAIVWTYASVSLLRDSQERPLYLIAQIQDITERKRAEAQIKNSLVEKEVLLKEIHHRVKNNLQVISSLLNLQSGYIRDPDTNEQFRESQNRVRSMALIHEKLYQSQDLARIDFNEYVISLVAMLFRSYGTNQGAVKLESRIDPVFLNIDTAIPVGLLINELVSNSLKHAFPDNRSGKIIIEFKVDGDRKYVLRFRDDGVGVPPGFELDKAPSLGLRLVKILTSQLGGKLAFHQNGGTEFTITFKEH